MKEPVAICAKVAWLLSFRSEAAPLTTSTSTFCGPGLDPSLRISSGSFTLGSTSAYHSCLLKADEDVNTPRIDMDGIELEDVSVRSHPRCRKVGTTILIHMLPVDARPL